MSGASSVDGACRRCGEDVVFVDTDAKRGSYFHICLDCGEMLSEERSELFWEDLRVGRVDDPRADRYWEIASDEPAGLLVTRRRGGGGATIGLGWDDPHGDAARREVHERNAGLASDDPTFVVEAYLSLFNPVSRRWERSYLSVGEPGPRFVNTAAEYRDAEARWNG